MEIPHNLGVCLAQVGDGTGISGENNSVLDFMSMKPYSMSLDMSVLNNLGEASFCVHSH